MQTRKIVSSILEDALFQREAKPYKNVYFIKPLNPGDRKQFFCSFRFKTSKGEVLLCRVEINLEYENNTVYGISLLKPRERESITFFRKRQRIVGKSILEIIQSVVVPVLTDKINKVESMYEQVI